MASDRAGQFCTRISRPFYSKLEKLLHVRGSRESLPEFRTVLSSLPLSSRRQKCALRLPSKSDGRSGAS
jgi:hypothetical protein